MRILETLYRDRQVDNEARADSEGRSRGPAGGEPLSPSPPKE
jgi:hypothetical protein